MKQQWIVQNGNPELALFFAGWGMDAHPFAHFVPPAKDLLVCYDYRFLDADFSFLKSYNSVSLTAWSFGVWAANRVFSDTPDIFSTAVAINGTLFPVDDMRGIPEKIFSGTLEGLNPCSLQKFYRRMCGNQNAYECFLKNKPERDIDELREELIQIYQQYSKSFSGRLHWNKAIICSDDAIFSCMNQQRAWIGTPVQIVSGNHFDEILLQKTIGSNG